jgi:hypothetical protein
MQGRDVTELNGGVEQGMRSGAAGDVGRPGDVSTTRRESIGPLSRRSGTKARVITDAIGGRPGFVPGPGPDHELLHAIPCLDQLSGVPGSCISPQRPFKQLLQGFNVASTETPDQVTAECLKARCRLSIGKLKSCAGPDEGTKAQLIVDAAEGVSQPDIGTVANDSAAAVA